MYGSQHPAPSCKGQSSPNQRVLSVLQPLSDGLPGWQLGVGLLPAYGLHRGGRPQGITYSLGVCPQKPEKAVVQVEIFFLSPPVEGSRATFLKAPGGGHTTKGMNKEVGDSPSETYCTSPVFSGLGALLQESLRYFLNQQYL